MKTIILMIGISGSGKSTYIDKHLSNYQLISPDDIKDVIGGEFYTTWASFNSKEKYSEISANDAVAKTSCEAYMKRERPIVIDDLNIDKNKIKEWLNLADKYDYKKTAIILKESFDVCISRRSDFPIEILKGLKYKFEFILDDCETMNMFDDLKIIGED
jgi:predicted kinase